MKKHAFTMIELIFVIVILGILAAVAVPKLAATRTDADDVIARQHLAQFIRDAQNTITARGDWPSTWGGITKVPLENSVGGLAKNSSINSSLVVLKRGIHKCIHFGFAANAFGPMILSASTFGAPKECNNLLSFAKSQKYLESNGFKNYDFLHTSISY